MPKTLSQAWVKNVYNLRKGTRTTSVLVSPQMNTWVHKVFTYVHKHIVIPSLIHGFYPQLFTAKSIKSHLLSSTYTHNPQGLLLREKRKDKKGTLAWN